MSAETRHAAAARVTCEDLVVFLNACFCCTGQREFYSDGRAQTVSIEFLHDYIRGNYRRLYARTLAAGVNHFNRARIVTELLASSRHLEAGERRDEGRLVIAALRSLPAPRAYRALLAVRARGVNNRRLRAIVRDFLSSRPDLQFDAIKYRGKLRDLILHTHLRLPGELGGFLFKGWKQRRYATPLLETFRQAHFSDEAMYELPFTVAEGMAARRNIDRAVFLRKIAPRLTALEKLRLQNAAAREGVKELAIDLARAGLTRVAIYLLSLPSAERRERRSELQAALDGAARRCLREAPLALGRVVAVLDRSHSTTGSPDKPRRSLAVALGVDALLRAASAEYMSFWTPAEGDPLLAGPRGQTDLTGPLLDALETRPDLVVVVSDGFDNDPTGGAGEICRVFKARLDPEGRTTIVHINPVFDAPELGPRRLGPGVPTLGLRDAEDLPTALAFARFAAGDLSLAELEDYLARRVDVFLRRADVAPLEEGA
ncbi:hypothetical protein OV079_03940 [Nannocystis pusilla]|uniref:VWA domain-containing protein n=1 Tax=Nannocystis pusilla TaxID=889268 RepID=A0A9X3IVB9_9BACT|nr:hypothetical protein [Nannocystis pusilla]MCY1004735.1 hypothetical protein [Nannocystis pusilla]